MEDIGIFREGRRRAQFYGGQNAALRRKILGAGPVNGAYAETVNPFDRPRRLPMKARKPFWEEHRESKIRRRLNDGTLVDDLDVTPVEIVQAVCLVTDNDVGQMLNGYSRKWRVAHPRQVAMYLIARYSQLSLMQIGFLFSKDHTTVMHAIRVVPARIDAGNAQVRALVEDVITQLRQV